MFRAPTLMAAELAEKEMMWMENSIKNCYVPGREHQTKHHFL
jgi:hypothetical protein